MPQQLAAPLTPYSPDRNPKSLATGFDLVVTTYQTLGSDHGRQSDSDPSSAPLEAIKWVRWVRASCEVDKWPWQESTGWVETGMW